MVSIPVCLDDNTTDILRIHSRLKRGHGNILLLGAISGEIENEIQKAIRCAADLGDLGEFEFPDLSVFDLHISFTCRLSDLPIVGQSYGLGLGVELLRLFSGRSWPLNWCYTGCLGADGSILPVECLEQKLSGAATAGFDRAFLPSKQLRFWEKNIRQVPVTSLYEAWGVLCYGENCEA